MILVVADGPELAAALRGLGVRARAVRPREATAGFGFAVGVDVVVMGCSPGDHPLVEGDAFQSATLLYAHASETSCTIGPVALSGATPCPACLGQSHDEGPLRPGLTLTWVAASVALELHTLATQRVSTLLAARLRWSLHPVPGLTATALGRRQHCSTVGCVAPMSS